MICPNEDFLLTTRCFALLQRRGPQSHGCAFNTTHSIIPCRCSTAQTPARSVKAFLAFVLLKYKEKKKKNPEVLGCTNL